METLYRLISGLTAGFIALFAPIGPLVACAMAFIGIDFLSGVAASRAAARRKGHTWYFESCEAWRTVLKLGTYLDPPVGKSGVNHRLRKLAAIAENLI